MKKLFFTFSTILILFSCSSSDDSTDSSFTSPYNPPSWIQGTWGIKANGTTILNDNPFYKFTSDNVCQITSGISTLCWKDAIHQSPTVLSGSEVITNSTYEASFISGGGSSTLTLKFEKVTASQIKWVGSSSGDILLEKLN